VTRKIFDAALNGQFAVVSSREIFDEVLVTLERPAFEVAREDIERVKTFFSLHVRFVRPESRLDICRDPNDDKLLECLLAARPSCLVTRDRDLLVLHPFHGIPIVTPEAFLTTVLRSS
jgi:putative PIN family toxin of toxin-antitoxin system